MLQVFNRFRDPVSVIRNIKKVRVNGVLFHIRKLDPLDHAKGLKVMLKLFETYKRPEKQREMSEGELKKVRQHYRDVFFASVVKPKLVPDENTENICVDELFTDGDMAEKLYNEIMNHTYGKKKLKLLHMQKAGY